MESFNGKATTETRRHGDTDMGVSMVHDGLVGETDITDRIIACAIAVHRELGPGLLESAYEAALRLELEAAGLRYRTQVPVPLVYRGRAIGEYRLDLLVEDTVVVEVKTATRFEPVFDAQVLTYLRLTGKHVGLLVNFYSRTMKDGIKRYVL
jgi:GxxExxY protein